MKGSAQSVYSIATSNFIDTFFLLNTAVWLFEVLFFSYTNIYLIQFLNCSFLWKIYMKGSAQSVYSIATSNFIDTFFLLNTAVWLFEVLFFSYTNIYLIQFLNCSFLWKSSLFNVRRIKESTSGFCTAGRNIGSPAKGPFVVIADFLFSSK